MKTFHRAVTGIENEVAKLNKTKAFSIMSFTIIGIVETLGRLDAYIRIVTALLILGMFAYYFPPKGGWSSTFFRCL